MVELTDPQSLLRQKNELVEALEQATEVLEIEFRDTEGSGHETLLKCRKALTRAASQAC